MKIFGFDLEFDHSKIRKNIEDCCKTHEKGYACIVDGPSLVRSHTTPEFLYLLDHSYFNSCDGGSIAVMASHLYNMKLRAFTGPEIFAEYITRTEFRQVVIGNTEDMFGKVKAQLEKRGYGSGHIFHIPLPFRNVEDFDYTGISAELARMDADIIWVSLGAPKQEYFMQRLLPHIEKGLMLGIGAALAFWIGELKDYSFHIGEYRFNWIYRLFTEPKKQFARISTIFRYYPVIYYKEKKKLRL